MARKHLFEIFKICLSKKNPVYFLIGSIVLLIVTTAFYFGSNPKVEFFPSADPNYINVICELPIGTDIDATDEMMVKIEEDVYEIIGEHQDLLKSVVTIVGKGAVGENEGFSGKSGGPNRGLITISFIDYEFRDGYATSIFLKTLNDGSGW